MATNYNTMSEEGTNGPAVHKKAYEADPEDGHKHRFDGGSTYDESETSSVEFLPGVKRVEVAQSVW